MKLSLEWPYWLMISGSFLVVIGITGVLVSRKRADEADTAQDEPIQTPKAQMPALPKLLDSRGKTATKSEVKEDPPA
ncbi:hypothetical protein ACRQ5Q_22930 [Bradyrhizobium sp. PMVTL-01]|uniref:hypothetical protein n=1 Tax=unclassified Bradyrhizobium TaxID=2631580 RepID=UPI003F6F0A44